MSEITVGESPATRLRDGSKSAMYRRLVVAAIENRGEWVSMTTVDASGTAAAMVARAFLTALGECKVRDGVVWVRVNP